MTAAAVDHAVLQDLVGAFADAELPRGEARVVEEHLRTCAWCRRELALQRGLSSALAREPVRGASPRLRRRIEQLELPTSRSRLVQWTRWAAPAAAALVPIALVLGAALASVGIGNAGARLAGRAEAIAQSPLLRDAVANCRGVMARNFPNAADVPAVAAGLPFPVGALDRPDVQLFSTWKTTLAGSPAAGLAYRWRGIVVVQYVVPAELIRQQPGFPEGLRGDGIYFASDRGQGVVASIAGGRGTLLVGDAPPETLRRLIL